MKITSENYNVQLTFDELYAVGWALKNSIEASAENHWKHHQDAYPDQETKMKTEMMVSVFNAVGYPHIARDCQSKVKKIFDTHNEPNTKK